jgi:outer membrane immunogenic protein
MTKMQTMKHILVTVMASVLTAGAALASDLPPPATVPPRAPAVYLPAPPAYNWSGFYLGINGGWASARATGIPMLAVWR